MKPKPSAGALEPFPGCGKGSSESGSGDDELSSERYEAVLSSISDGVFTIDAGGRTYLLWREVSGRSHDRPRGGELRFRRGVGVHVGR